MKVNTAIYIVLPNWNWWEILQKISWNKENVSNWLPFFIVHSLPNYTRLSLWLLYVLTELGAEYITKSHFHILGWICQILYYNLQYYFLSKIHKVLPHGWFTCTLTRRIGLYYTSAHCIGLTHQHLLMTGGKDILLYLTHI